MGGAVIITKVSRTPPNSNARRAAEMLAGAVSADVLVDWSYDDEKFKFTVVTRWPLPDQPSRYEMLPTEAMWFCRGVLMALRKREIGVQ